jgi:malonyl-CoA decarboxylase
MDMPTIRKKPAASSSRLRNAMESVLGTRLGKMLGRIGIAPKGTASQSLLDIAGALLSLRGKASGPALASAFFDLYESSDVAARNAFLSQVHAQHPRNGEAIDRAIANWQQSRDDASALRLHEAAESPCHKLIRRLNLAPGGTRRLIAMRADLLAAPDQTESMRAFDADFEDVFAGWFNAGFLELRPIDWTSPAAILERIIRYEAVHSINGWGDLRSRLAPADRRCYAFFHPQMSDDPLIFVEVALTNALPSAIASIIAEEREEIDPRAAQCAIFYSISNCQNGLRGIPFGNYLIKRVVGLLREELPQLAHYATLSPVPGFAAWLKEEQGPDVPPPDELKVLTARYLTTARNVRGQVRDTVARFHLGNGARLEAIHSDADLSANGRKQSHGVMVNYLYDLADIEANTFALAEMGTVAASKTVTDLIAAKVR